MPIDVGAATIGLATVVAANVVYLAGLTSVVDPVDSMEPYYIHMARLPVAEILRQAPSWGPAYGLWLKPFVALLGDPLAVYAANLCVLSVAVSVAVYGCVLVATRRAVPAAGAALVFLISDLNVPLSGKVCSFALLLVLVGLCQAGLARAGVTRAAVAASAVLVASYARPELYPAALVLGLVSVWRASRSEGARAWLWPAAALVAILILALALGTPISGGDHLLSAFQATFAWNWNRWHGDHRDLFSIWRHEFGTATSVTEAIRVNPGAVARHIADNLLGTLRWLGGSAFDHYPVLVPATSGSLVRVESAMLSVGAFAVLAAGLRTRRHQLDGHGDALFLSAVVAFFPLTSGVAVYPSPRYLLVPGVLLMLAVAESAAALLPTGPRLPWTLRVVGALACVAAVPKPFVLPTAYEVDGAPFRGRITVARTMTDTVAFVRSLGLPAPLVVLTATDGIGEMCGPGFRELRIWEKHEQPLADYMRANDVGLVINLEGGHTSFGFDDPYWAQFQLRPEDAGFVRLSVPGHAAVGMYVRADLVAKSGEPPPP